MKNLLIAACVTFLFFISCNEDVDKNDYDVIVLDTDNAVYSFKTGEVYSWANMPEDIDQYGILNEPWCTELPALCGNYLITDEDDFNSFVSVPTGDFVNYCEEMELNKIIIFKLGDGSYALVKIVNDVYETGDDGCEHTVTLHIVYPALEGLSNKN